MRRVSLLAASIVAFSAFLFSPNAALAADVRFDYTGLPFMYTPPPSNPGMTNPYGTRLNAVAFFDASVVTPSFTGSIQNLAHPSTGGSPMFGQFDFVNGQIVGWDLQSFQAYQMFSGSSLVTARSVNSNDAKSDSIMPISPRYDNVGWVRTSGAGTWTRVPDVPQVPLPAAFPLLMGALCVLRLFRRCV